jgi:hypothetical protein
MDTGSGIGKAAEELMKEMQKAQAEVHQKSLDKVGGGSPTQDFGQVLQSHQTQEVGKVSTSKVHGAHKAANILAQAKINASAPSQKVNEVATAQRSKMADMLQELIGGQDKMTGIMKMALSGRQFSPPELLAMQAGVYRFSQELELTSKVIEKATSGIKQTMNTQV